MGTSESGLVGLLSALDIWDGGGASGNGMGIHCITNGKEGSIVSYALGESLTSATSAEIK